MDLLGSYGLQVIPAKRIEEKYKGLELEIPYWINFQDLIAVLWDALRMGPYEILEKYEVLSSEYLVLGYETQYQIAHITHNGIYDTVIRKDSVGDIAYVPKIWVHKVLTAVASGVDTFQVQIFGPSEYIDEVPNVWTKNFRTQDRTLVMVTALSIDGAPVPYMQYR
jgi:hypothetical protein